MRGPVITVDVSKDSCHYQPFLEKGKPFRKPKVLHDTIEGLTDLNAIIEKTKRISKKGNRHLRCLLYLGASCNYRLKKKDPLYLFNQKKRQQSISPLKSKAANIAAAHKLLTIIYALSKSGELYRS